MQNIKHHICDNDNAKDNHGSSQNAVSRREMLILSAAAALGACSAQEETRYRYKWPKKISKPNIVVYLADALRADALGAYSSKGFHSPFIDAFARESIVFDHCFSQATWTKPSMASLFSGVLPGIHQAVMSEWQGDPSQGLQILRNNFLTFAEALKDEGYQTALFQTNPNASEQLGFRQGFDHYCYVLEQPKKEQVFEALQWLDGIGEGPFLLFIHGIDPHGPYLPSDDTCRVLYGLTREESRAKLSQEDQELIRRYDRHYIDGGGREGLPLLSAEGVTHLKNQYLGEVYEVDGAFRLLYSALAFRGLLDNTYLAFTSDHGESFGEFGLFCHTNPLHWPELHIPLLVRPPGGCSGERVQATVGLYDLYPSFLSIADLPVPEYVTRPALFDTEGLAELPLNSVTFAQNAHQHPDPDEWSPAVIGNDILGVWDRTLENVVFNGLYHPDPNSGLRGLDNNQRRRLNPMYARLKEENNHIHQWRPFFGPPEVITVGEKWNQDDKDKLFEDLRAIGYLDK